MRVIKNTYPAIDGVARAEPGDEVRLEPRRDGGYTLIRVADGARVYSSPDRRQDSPIPPTSGVIAAVRSRGWYLEIE